MASASASAQGAPVGPLGGSPLVGSCALDRRPLAQTAHSYAAGGVGRKRDREAFEECLCAM
eukprot:CAMPEP_0174704316 /NCGR_PEP_ID=MMETSP1094-20130205/7963_1 /TAXON_ID=156173 /ORGANISM="Chrysochromulina brevifilum, Strain UTEX LB 985" /LENGTH=60 /DNA_ID=CAMNT_0015902365 /DNA_START=17 /DNA_END=200 /DNA_ORIENTATION=-